MVIFSADEDQVKTGATLNELLDQSTYQKAKAILADSNISEQEFEASASAAVFQYDDLVSLAWIRDICGFRLVILGPSVNELNASPQLMKNIRIHAKANSCNLIQILHSPDDHAALESLPTESYISNFVFSLNLSSPIAHVAPKAQLPITLISDADWLTSQAPLYEYDTRWRFPGGSYFRLDTIDGLRKEYAEIKELLPLGIVKVAALASAPSDAFVLWFENRSRRSAVIGHIWVHDSLKGQGLGTLLLLTAVEKLKAGGFNSLEYFVSAQNYSALQMLRRSGFALKYLVINQVV